MSVDLSVISPVYGCVQSLPLLVQKVDEAIRPLGLSYEIILVDDRGPGNAWEVIRQLAANNPNVRGIRLSRNFGQHYAITAGIDVARGQNIVILDCDLQDDPTLIPRLLEERKAGYEVVFTYRKKRGHGWGKRISSFLYNQLFRLLSNQQYNIEYGSLVLFSDKVAREFRKLREISRLYVQVLKWLGFSSTAVEVPHHPRQEGRSGYSLKKLIRLGIYGWIAHSNRLLQINVVGGLILSALSLLVGGVVFIRYFFYDVQPGWTSLILTILFSTGLILTSIGISGLYIGLIFEEVKKRPLYVVEDTVNLPPDALEKPSAKQ